MDTTLLFWDFFWIAIIVMVFGGGASYATSTKGSGDTERLNLILKKLEELKSTDKPD